MPGLRSDNRVEFPACGFPVFELGYLDRDPALPGQGGHARVGIHPEHSTPGRLELSGRYAGTTTDIENLSAGAGGNDALH